jgi:butyryl-CoA dehydrogenase
MLRDLVAKFAKEQIAPVAHENQKHSIFPTGVIREASALGLLGIAYPAEYGGAGMDYVSYMLAIEEISRYCASTGVIISAHSSLATDPIYRFGTEQQKQRYLPDLCSGKKLGCFGLTESGAGSDAGATRTTARQVGDTWVLNGSKQFITNGKEADVAVLFASTDPPAKTKGITAFIVEAGTEGYRVGKIEHKLGIRASSTTEIVLEDCVIPKANVLGEVNKGFKVAMVTLDGGRLGIASQALGIARASLEDAVAYARERQQFNHPIGEFQAVQWMLADMLMEYESAWLLTYRASLMKDRGIPYSAESATAKLKASETAMFCASKAVQIHGGYGYIEDFPVERYYRDAKITEIYEGTSEIMRLVIAGSLLR